MIMTQTMSDVQQYSAHAWESIVEALRNELQEYGALLNLLNAHENSITERNSDQILELNDSIDEQILQSTKFRQMREEAVQEFAENAGKTPDSTIKELLYLFPNHTQDLILTLVDEIIAMIQKTQRKARQNQMLIRKATQFTEELLARLHKKTNTKTYNRKGNINGGVCSQISCMNATA